MEYSTGFWWDLAGFGKRISYVVGQSHGMKGTLFGHKRLCKRVL